MAGKRKKAQESTVDSEEEKQKEEVGESNAKKGKKECNWCGEWVATSAKICRFCHNSFDKRSAEEDKKTFTIIKEKLPGREEPYKLVKIKGQELMNALQSYVPEFQSSWDPEVPIPAKQLCDALPKLRKASTYYGRGMGMENPLAEIIEWLEEEFKQQLKVLENMIEKGVITFDGLPNYFEKGKRVVGAVNTYLVGGEIISTKVIRSVWQTAFVIKTQVIKSDGQKFYKARHSYLINGFDGVIPITDLPVQILTDKLHKELTERGAIFRKYAIGNHHLVYKGTMHFSHNWWQTSWNADGRIVIDTMNFNKVHPECMVFNPQQATGYDADDQGAYEVSQLIQHNASIQNANLSDDELWRTWPTLAAFSLVKKKWGEVFMGGLSEVQYDVDAFSKLVLPAEKKELITSFILHSEGMKNDLISGKGGGALFLLHGPPGCGKTLTAEAIAEMLKRPLYKVDCGELTADGLFAVEGKLSRLLELASAWSAVVLIDEADIFLEKRSSNNIDRNAVVGTFLRLLEYYTGVLFLTSNRVHDFDEAFYSRIQVKLKYHDLDKKARECVWTNFLVGSVDSKDISTLAEIPLNGREIRNVIQLAKAIARGEGQSLSRRHLEKVVALYQQFDKEMKEEISKGTTETTADK